MDDHKKKIVGIYVFSITVLALMLWMPLYLAGPDGLEQVMADVSGNEEYEPEGSGPEVPALFPDYEIPGIENNYFIAWLVGVIGSLITFAAAIGIFKLFQLKKNAAISDKKSDTHVSN